MDALDWEDIATEKGWLNPEMESRAIMDVFRERHRHGHGEGFTPAGDDRYTDFQLAKAAVCYAQVATYKDKTRKDAAKRTFSPGNWPWSLDWWKPKDRRSDLVRAASLIIAEIERLDRAAAAQQQGERA